MLAKKKRVCVYCGSRMGLPEKYAKLAAELGQALVRNKWGLVYGGGRVGLMGVVSQSAMQAGGEVIGVIPDGLFGKEVADTSLTELQVVGSMHERKARMEQLSDAFLAIPGGWGTLDEFFEILTWSQIGIHRKPVVLLNFEGFFDPLLTQMQRMVAEGFVSEEAAKLLLVAGNLDEALAACAD